MLKQKKLKICHVTNYYPGFHELWAGAEIAAKGFVDLLNKFGEENHVLFTKPIKELDKK